MQTLNFDVFGRRVAIDRTEGGWQAFYPGADGTRRPAGDITVPSHITEAELAQYLDDFCHEWATERHPAVYRL